MSFLITRRPEKLFTLTTKWSRWTALANPYLFEFTRADFTVSNTAIRNAYSTTKPTVWLGSADPVVVAGFVIVGEQIYLNSGIYNGLYTVLAVSGNYVTIDTPFIGNGGSGRLNVVEQITNFKAYINIYDNVTGDIIDSMYPKPDSTGFLIQDVSGVIRSIVDTQTTIDQSGINRANKGLSGGFTVGYGATYRIAGIGDVTLPEVISADKVYYWISAARQVQGDTSLGMAGIGQNMKEYVPKNLASSDAKFLTMFERPTYFEGFPFFMSFLYDEDFNENYLERHQQDVDVNGTSVGAETDTNLLVSERGYVNQMLVRTPNTGASGFDVWLEVGDTIEDGYVDGGAIELGAASQFAAPYLNLLP